MPNILIHKDEKRSFTLSLVKLDGSPGSAVTPPTWELFDPIEDPNAIPPVLPAGIVTVSVDGLVAEVEWAGYSTGCTLTATIDGGGNVPFTRIAVIDFVAATPSTGATMTVGDEVPNV